MENNLLYHGSAMEVIYPEIRITRYTKDFSWGFYCTNSYEQAYRWADRRSSHGIVNVYKYTENPELKILHFPKMNDEWLDFIARCRSGESHSYDIVEGVTSTQTRQDSIMAEYLISVFFAFPTNTTPAQPFCIQIICILQVLVFLYFLCCLLNDMLNH